MPDALYDEDSGFRMLFENAGDTMFVQNDYTAIEWQHTFDAINDAVILLSPEHRILRCNKASYKIFNKVEPDEILEKFCWEIVHSASEMLPTCPVRVMEKQKEGNFCF